MGNIKYVPNGGLAFSEEKDMKKLQEYAKDGWLLESIVFGGFSYKLRKGESQDIIYSVATQRNADDDYFAYFKAAGWTLVYSVYDTHIFSAPAGTKPIYTDKTTIKDRYEGERKMLAKPAVSFLLSTIILGIFLRQFGEGLPGIVLLVLFLLSAICLVFTGMPYFGYRWRLKKLDRGKL